MSAVNGQRLKPRSRSGANVKHTTQSRSKETQSTHTLKSEPKSHSATVTVTPRHHLYFPVKDIRPYVNGRPDDSRVSVVTGTTRKGWEVRVCEKSRGQMRKRSHSTSVYMEPWSKYETIQNYRNAVGPLISNIQWNPALIQDNGSNRQNLNSNMSYNGGFRREPNILERPDPRPPLIGQPVESRDICTPEKPETMKSELKTELYTELLKFLTDDWSSKIEDEIKKIGSDSKMTAPPIQSLKPRKPLRSVTFTPDTVFFERNLSSRFWIEITYRQQLRKIQRRRLGKFDLRIKSSKKSTDLSVGVADEIISVEQPQPNRRPKNRQRNKSKSEIPRNGFWNGLRKTLASVFSCQSAAPSRSRIP